MHDGHKFSFVRDKLCRITLVSLTTEIMIISYLANFVITKFLCTVIMRAADFFLAIVACVCIYSVKGKQYG